MLSVGLVSRLGTAVGKPDPPTKSRVADRFNLFENGSRFKMLKSANFDGNTEKMFIGKPSRQTRFAVWREAETSSRQSLIIR